MEKRVYAIQHNVTKKIYIGSSARPETRFLKHMQDLKRGEHSVEDMQEDFNEYGEDFSFYILDEIKEYEDRQKEYEWMKKYNSNVRGIGYNYKDNEKKVLHSKYKVPYKSGIPKPMDEEYMDYVDKITILLNQCTDISLLDFIWQLLMKSKV